MAVVMERPTIECFCTEEVYADMFGRHMRKDHLLDEEGWFSEIRIIEPADFDTSLPIDEPISINDMTIRLSGTMGLNSLLRHVRGSVMPDRWTYNPFTDGSFEGWWKTACRAQLMGS